MSAALALATSLAGCAAAPGPSPTASVLGTIRITTLRAADDNHLFSALPRARLWTTSGPAPIEWTLTEGEATAAQVPVGSYTLSTFAWYLSDTLQCAPAPNGGPGETCFQPTFGPSLTCDLPVTVTATVPVEMTFHLLASGRCVLAPGAPNATGASPSSPG